MNQISIHAGVWVRTPGVAGAVSKAEHRSLSVPALSGLVAQVVVNGVTDWQKVGTGGTVLPLWREHYVEARLPPQALSVRPIM